MEEFFDEEKQKDIMRMQQKRLMRILKLNRRKHEESEELQKYTKLFVWKVLIYDSHAKNVLTSLLKASFRVGKCIGWEHAFIQRDAFSRVRIQTRSN